MNKEGYGILALIFFSIYNGMILMALDMTMTEYFIIGFFFLVGALSFVLSLTRKEKHEEQAQEVKVREIHDEPNKPKPEVLQKL